MAIQRHGAGVLCPLAVKAVPTDGQSAVALLAEPGTVPQLTDCRFPLLASVQQVRRVGQEGGQESLEPRCADAAKGHRGLHVDLLALSPVWISGVREYAAYGIDHVTSNGPHRVRIWLCRRRPHLQWGGRELGSNYFLCTGGAQRLRRSAACPGRRYFEVHRLLPKVCTRADAVTHTLSPCCAQASVESWGAGSYRD